MGLPLFTETARGLAFWIEVELRLTKERGQQLPITDPHSASLQQSPR